MFRNFLLENDDYNLRILQKAFDNMKNREEFRIALMDRARTDYDGRWQAEYFYGIHKDLAKKESKIVVNGLIELEKILKKMGITERKLIRELTKTETILKLFIGNENPEKYFRNMKLETAINEYKKSDFQDFKKKLIKTLKILKKHYNYNLRQNINNSQEVEYELDGYYLISCCDYIMSSEDEHEPIIISFDKGIDKNFLEDFSKLFKREIPIKPEINESEYTIDYIYKG